VNGERKKKSHAKAKDDGRMSITALRGGSAAGHKAPTVWLMEGKNRRKEHSDSWLQRQGAPAFSTIVMTPAAFMTKEAWVRCAQIVAEGIRAAPVVRDHPDWLTPFSPTLTLVFSSVFFSFFFCVLISTLGCRWVMVTLDGISAHELQFEALEIFRSFKIRVVVEQSNTSHVNQPFDDEVAHTSKASIKFWLPLLRDTPGVMQVITVISFLLLV
jgi:hypothetical protein